MTDTNHTDSVEAILESLRHKYALYGDRGYSHDLLQDIRNTLTTLQAHTAQQVEEAVLQADATGAYHSGYLAGKAEVEEAVRAERSRIYGRLAQMKSVYETMDTGSALVVLLGEDIVREETPNH